MWDYSERLLEANRTLVSEDDDDDLIKQTMTISSYSSKSGYLAVGGVEGVLLVYDLTTKIKVSQ